MSKYENKSNNEILLDIKHLEQEHETLKTNMIKDIDTIEALKLKIKRDFSKLEEVEEKFKEANEIIVRRLKGNV